MLPPVDSLRDFVVPLEGLLFEFPWNAFSKGRLIFLLELEEPDPSLLDLERSLLPLLVLLLLRVDEINFSLLGGDGILMCRVS